MEKFGFCSICIYNNIDSFDIAARSIEKSNFLISSHLKDNTIRRSPSSTIPSFSTGFGDEDFCVNTKNSRDYYSLLTGKKAKLPNAITFLHRDFKLSEKELQQVFLLPHKVVLNLTSELFNIKY